MISLFFNYFIVIGRGDRRMWEFGVNGCISCGGGGGGGWICVEKV